MHGLSVKTEISRAPAFNTYILLSTTFDDEIELRGRGQDNRAMQRGDTVGGVRNKETNSASSLGGALLACKVAVEPHQFACEDLRQPADISSISTNQIEQRHVSLVYLGCSRHLPSKGCYFSLRNLGPSVAFPP